MKPRSDSKLKTLTPERQADIVEYARGNSLVETVAWLRKDGVVTSRSRLAEFLEWWQLEQRFNRAETNTAQFKEWLAKASPGLSEEELDRRAALMFQYEAVKAGDSDTYLKFASARAKGKLEQAKLEQRDRALQMERDKFTASLKTKIEAGLDALFEEVKGNAEARELFQKFKAVVTKA